MARPTEGGAVSAIVLNFTQNQVLRGASANKVFKLRYRYLPPIQMGDANQACTIDFPARLKTGGFVNNTVTASGQSFPPRLHKLTVKPAGIPPRLLGFIRGNANDDGRVDIADAISLVQAVVPSLGGPPLACRAAGDANDDGGVNLVDAIFLINYLFRAGPAPPAPHPRCGLPLDGSAGDCPDGSAFCSRA